jgi:hypothetical protein
MKRRVSKITPPRRPGHDPAPIRQQLKKHGEIEVIRRRRE